MKNIYNAPNKEVAAMELGNLENGEVRIHMPYFHGGTMVMT